jgi:exosome complex protein LRP1
MEKGSSALQIPDSIMESVKLTMANLEQVNTQLLDFVSTADSQVLADMPPLQRAQALLMLAKATTVIFALRVRCSGVNPEDHPVKSELERMSVYQDKLERFIHLSRAPLRPSTTLNALAATRVIGHSLPGLTSAQRQSMREISRGKRPVSGQKRKYEAASGKQSVQTAAKEFLEKAARELLGDDNDGALKGPVQIKDAE